MNPFGVCRILLKNKGIARGKNLEGKPDAMVAGVRPVLDCIDMEVAPQPNDRPPRPDAIIDRCKTAWENFKGFN